MEESNKVFKTLLIASPESCSLTRCHKLINSLLITKVTICVDVIEAIMLLEEEAFDAVYIDLRHKSIDIDSFTKYLRTSKDLKVNPEVNLVKEFEEYSQQDVEALS